MKDYTLSGQKHSRGRVYPKRKPSPRREGVIKTLSTGTHAQRSPFGLNTDQRIRQCHLKSYRREGMCVEEEYRTDVSTYMHQMEKCTMGCPVSMDQQPEIQWHMRPCLVDFLVEIHFTFRLRPETLYLTLNIVDRYVSRRIVFTKHYQLVGCAAFWIAAKFEDAKERVPSLQDLVHICNDAYDESAFIQMEGHVLATIQWTLGHPTAEAWLRLLCCEAYVEEAKIQHVARFLMEITLFYREFVKFVPSAIALASLVLARYTCDQPCLPVQGVHDCFEIVDLLDERLASSVADISETLVKKYSFSFYSKASTHILQWYLTGNRFCLKSLRVPNLNSMTMQYPRPSRTPPDVLARTESPVEHPHAWHNPFVDKDKENLPITSELPAQVKHQHTIDDVINTSRYAEVMDGGARLVLHDLNGVQV